MNSKMSNQPKAEDLRNEMLRFLQDSHGLSTTTFSSGHKLKDAGIDSFKIIELILFMENKFNIKFPEESYTAANLSSIDSIIKTALAVNPE